MKSLKKIMAMLLATLMMVGLIGCGGSDSSSSADTSDDTSTEAVEPIELKFPHIYTATSNENKWINWIADEVEARTEGGLIINVYADSQLGTEAEITPQVVAGDLDITLCEGSVWADVMGTPELGVFGLPYLCDSAEGMKAVGQTMVADSFATMAEELNVPLHCFGPFSGGLRSVVTVEDGATTAAELNGLKLRVPEVKLYVDTMAALGTVPTTVSWAETYNALSSGVVEGLENDASSIVSANLHEVLGYWIETNHLACFNIICMNKDSYDALPAEYQQVLDEVFAEAIAQQFDDRNDDINACRETIAAAGVEFITLPESEMDILKESVKPLWDEYDANYGLGEMIEAMAAVGCGQ